MESAPPLQDRTVATAEGGAVAVLVAVCLTTLLGASALAIDYGNMTLTKVQLQNAAEAAALAGMTELPNKAEALAAAKAVGAKYTAGGKPVQFRDEDIMIGEWDGTKRSVKVSANPPSGVWVRAERSKANPAGALDLWFGRVFGEDKAEVGAAAAAVKGTPKTANIIPMALRAHASFGTIDPAVTARNPGKDGPSYPMHPDPDDPNAKFHIGDEITIMMEGKGKKSPIHLTLKTGDEQKILRGEQAPPPATIGQVWDVEKNNGVISAIEKRLDYASTHPLRTVHVPIVSLVARDNKGVVTRVKVEAFAAVHIAGMREADVPDPEKPGQFTRVSYMYGTIVKETVSAAEIVATPKPLLEDSISAYGLVA